MTLATKLQNILAARGKTADFTLDVTVSDDGRGPELVKWDTAKLGSVPTDAEIAAASSVKPEPTIAQKLDALGIPLADLKAALAK